MRAELGAVPVILISAHLETDGLTTTPGDVFSDRLRKPFTPAALLARVHAAAQREMVATHADVIDEDQITAST